MSQGQDVYSFNEPKELPYVGSVLLNKLPTLTYLDLISVPGAMSRGFYPFTINSVLRKTITYIHKIPLRKRKI